MRSYISKRDIHVHVLVPEMYRIFHYLIRLFGTHHNFPTKDLRSKRKISFQVVKEPKTFVLFIPVRVRLPKSLQKFSILRVHVGERGVEVGEQERTLYPLLFPVLLGENKQNEITWLSKIR